MYTKILLCLSLILLWVAIAKMAIQQKRRAWPWIFLSVIATPVTPMVILYILGKLPQKKTAREQITTNICELDTRARESTIELPCPVCRVPKRVSLRSCPHCGSNSQPHVHPALRIPPKN